MVLRPSFLRSSHTGLNYRDYFIIKEGGFMNVPQHIAIILDGNGRWAKAKGMPRI